MASGFVPIIIMSSLSDSWAHLPYVLANTDAHLPYVLANTDELAVRNSMLRIWLVHNMN